MRSLAFVLLLTICFQNILLGQEPIHLSGEDRALLKKIQRDSFQYFISNSHPETGLTYDSSRTGSPASIAATGFALAGLSIASVNGWLTYKEAYEKIEQILDTLEHKVQNEKGFFYHFIDAQTGRRVWSSEASSIDTALLLAGALLASYYFKGTTIEARVQALYDRVDWRWMQN